jgi:hypothetical protein
MRPNLNDVGQRQKREIAGFNLNHKATKKQSCCFDLRCFVSLWLNFSNVHAGLETGAPSRTVLRDPGRQERHQMDPTVLSRLCGQPGAAATVRVGVQPGQLPAASRVAPSGASLDVDDVAGETDQIGTKVVRHARQVVFQMAEVAVPRELFRAMLEGIQRLRLPTPMAG